MELLIAIALFLGYSGYREWLHAKHVKDLEIKLMAKDTNDYARIKHIDEPKVKPKVVEDSDEGYQDLEETSVDDVLSGKK